jgi:hypothetical protein
MTNLSQQATKHLRWRFSLRSLMFLTFVVAICAGLAGLAPVLAAVGIPFIVAAYLRTVGATRAMPTDLSQLKKRPGLFKTFCASIALFVALVVASAATAAIAGVVVSLSLIAAAWRLGKALRNNSSNWASFGWTIIREVSKYVRRCAVLFPPGALFVWSRERAFAAMTFLFGASRRLFWNCWRPQATIW